MQDYLPHHLLYLIGSIITSTLHAGLPSTTLILSHRYHYYQHTACRITLYNTYFISSVALLPAYCMQDYPPQHLLYLIGSIITSTLHAGLPSTTLYLIGSIITSTLHARLPSTTLLSPNLRLVSNSSFNVIHAYSVEFELKSNYSW